jgi:hypothetical protein
MDVVEVVENWEPLCIDDYYEISTLPPHHVRRASDGYVMSFRFDKDGYKTYKLRKTHHTKLARHHQLVALQWIPNPNNYPMIDHLDNDRTNNVVSNLRWVDCKQNLQNFSQKGGIKYDVVKQLPEDNFEITQYSAWTFADYYYSLTTEQFYFWTGTQYRVLRVLTNNSGGTFIHMRDVDNVHRSVQIRKFKLEYDLQ